MNFSIEIAIQILFGIVLILSIAFLFLLHRINKLFLGTKKNDLEKTLDYIRKELEAHHTFRDEMQAYLTTVEKRLKKSTQGIATIRFNPFKGNGGGGNQSFATCYLNEHGDGVVLSSLYSRDRVSVFAKEIKKFSSSYELTEEEQKAINEAKQNMRLLAH